MRILVTNDDGIDAPGIRYLTEFALCLADEVTVAAPDRGMSGKSQSLTLDVPFSVRRTETFPGAECWAVSGTPADCVLFAVDGLGKTYDLVLSGVNHGYNLGRDVSYSGTAGAIFEASFHGIPGIAVSRSSKAPDSPSPWFGPVMDFFRSRRLMEQNGLYNVNIPIRPVGIRVTRLGGTFGLREYGLDGEQCLPVYRGAAVSTDPDSDISAIRANMISVTPLTTDRTAPAFAGLREETEPLGT